ncbi:Jag N-terminal domain-containing protein, partial [Chloroflexota bacterium]
MEEGIEVSAKTVEEAIQLALDSLGISRSEVVVEVLHQGRSGILGIGAEEARVRVSVSEPATAGGENGDIAPRAKEVLERLLALLSVPAKVVLSDNSPESVILDIQGDDLGILIGRRGETLS